MRSIVHACALALLLAVPREANRAPEPMATVPDVVLWAWEHPQRLGFIDPKRVGVAWLALTLIPHPGRLEARPRLQPLVVPPGTALIAVVRIEPGADPATLTAARCAQAAEQIAALARRPGVVAVQVDYEAPVSERPFHGALMRAVRRRLPATTALSMTALASWCAGDRWLDDAPVDEIVPMLFRMGPEGPGLVRPIAGGRLRDARTSVGVSLDEAVPHVRAGRRAYVFTRGSWTREAVAAAFERLGRPS